MAPKFGGKGNGRKNRNSGQRWKETRHTESQLLGPLPVGPQAPETMPVTQQREEEEADTFENWLEKRYLAPRSTSAAAAPSTSGSPAFELSADAAVFVPMPPGLFVFDQEASGMVENEEEGEELAEKQSGANSAWMGSYEEDLIAERKLSSELRLRFAAAEAAAEAKAVLHERLHAELMAEQQGRERELVERLQLAEAALQSEREASAQLLAQLSDAQEELKRLRSGMDADGSGREANETEATSTEGSDTTAERRGVGPRRGLIWRILVFTTVGLRVQQRSRNTAGDA